MNDDSELLRKYVKDHSEEAFAELVRRHFGLVYNTALRLLSGDSHRAKDVAQIVFTDLARKANVLRQHTALTGWLYLSTRYTVNKAIRAEQRRQAHEKRAQMTQDNLPPPTPQEDWSQLRPVLDDVMGGLNASDREAVLLRFFEEKPYAEIGRILRLTEDAARMRIERALDRLNSALARRGVTSTTAAMATMLASHAGAAVPTGIAETVTAAALSGAAAGGGAFTTFVMITLSKLNITATAVLVAGLTAAVLEYRNSAGLRDDLRHQNQQISTLRAANQSLTDAAKKLRAQVVLLQHDATKSGSRPPNTTPSQSMQGRVIGESVDDGSMVPAKDWKNAGRTTARSALETALWATAGGDFNTLAGMVTLPAAARSRAMAILSGLPDDQRAKYNSPEQFVAFLLSSDSPLGAMQVIGHTSDVPDETTLFTLFQASDGKTSEANMYLHKAPDGWRLVIPANALDKYVGTQAVAGANESR